MHGPVSHCAVENYNPRNVDNATQKGPNLSGQVLLRMLRLSRIRQVKWSKLM